MGAGESSLSSVPKTGLHILRVTPSSPAAHTDIEPFFDFIVGFDGESAQDTEALGTELEKIVEQYEDRLLRLHVWNSKAQDTRVVPITPSRHWSLSTQPNSSSKDATTSHRPSLLGLSMRICDPSMALENVWHVMDVLEGSPAEMAGLVPYGDWVIGWSGGVLQEEGDFYDVVEAHADKPLRIYVYSYDFDTIREVVVIPNRHWGGEGLMGCVFGFGLLHRIPAVPRSQHHDVLATDLQPEQLFVPADVPSPTYDANDTYSSTSSPSSVDARRHLHHQAHEHVHDHGHNHSQHHEHDHSGHHHHEHDHDHDHDHPPPTTSPPLLQRQPFPRSATPLRASSFGSQRPASPGFSASSGPGFSGLRSTPGRQSLPRSDSLAGFNGRAVDDGEHSEPRSPSQGSLSSVE